MADTINNNQLQTNLGLSTDTNIPTTILPQNPAVRELANVPDYLYRPTSASMIPTEDNKRYERFFGQGYDPTANLEDQAALMQGPLERWGKFVPRIGVKIASEIAQMPGYMVGFGDWATTGFKAEEMGRMVDNAWIKTIQNLENQTKDKVLPIYIPDSVKNGNLLDNLLSSAFWATEGADGIGFLAAMLVPGMATRAAGLGGKAVNALGRTSMFAKTLKPGSQAAASTAGHIDDFTAAIFNTIFESGAEAGETFREVMKSSGGNKQKAGEAAAGVMGTNMLILLPSNILMQKWLMGDAFDKFFGVSSKKGFEKVMKNVSEAAAKASKTAPGVSKVLTSEIGKAAGELAPKKTISSLAETIPLGILSEGFWEEGTQFSTSEYYKKRAEGLTDAAWLGGISQAYIDGLSNVDMQKSIFLGAFLGSIMGGVGGIKQTQRENELLFGTPERKAKDIKLWDKMIGRRPKAAKQGFNDLIKDVLVNRYELSDVFKYKQDKDGNPTLVLNKKGLPVVDVSKYLTAMAKTLGIEVDAVAKRSTSALNDPETFKFLQYFNDFNTMLPFFNMDGGLELLDKFIDNLASTDVEYMKNFSMSGKSIEETAKNLKARAIEFKELHDNIEKKHRDNFDVKFESGMTSDYISFHKDLFLKRLDNSLKQKFLSQRLRELKPLARKLQITQDAGTNTSLQTDLLKRTNAQIDIYTKELTQAREDNKELYGKRRIQTKFDDYVGQMKETRKVLEDSEKEDAKSRIDDSESPKEVDTVVEEFTNAQPITEADLTGIEEQPVDTVPPAQEGKEEPVKNSFSANKDPSVEEHGENRKKELEAEEALEKDKEITISTASETMGEKGDPIANEEEIKKAETIIEKIIKTAKSRVDAMLKILSKYSFGSSEQHKAVLNFIQDRLTGTATMTFAEFRKSMLSDTDQKILNVVKGVVQDDETPPQTPDILHEQNNDAFNHEDHEDSKTKDTELSGSINIAYAHNETEETDQGPRPVRDEAGRPIVKSNADLTTNVPDKYTPGTRIVLYVDKNYEGSKEKGFKDSYENTKDDLNSLPIGIKLLDEYGNEVPTPLHLHTIDWLQENTKTEDLVNIIKVTKEIRKAIIESNEPMVTSILKKYTGWTIRQKEDQTLLDAFGNDPNIFFGLGNQAKSILVSTSSKEDIINGYSQKESGFPYIILPLANGQYVASFITRTPLVQNEDLYNKYIDNIIALLSDYSKDSEKEFFTADSPLDSLLGEVKKFFFVTNKYHKHWANDVDSRTIFNLRRKPGTEGVIMELPYLGKGTAIFSTFIWKNGMLYATYLKDGVRVINEVKNVKALFKQSFKKKYAQISKEYFLGINRKDSPKFYSVQVVDGKLQKVKQDYLEFINHKEIAATRIFGLEVGKEKIYTLQSTISIIPNVSELVPLSKAKEEEPVVSPTESIVEEALENPAPTTTSATEVVNLSDKVGLTVVVIRGGHKGKTGVIKGHTKKMVKVLFADGSQYNIAYHNIKPEDPIVKKGATPQRSKLFDRRGVKVTPPKIRRKKDDPSDDMQDFASIDYNNATLSSLQYFESFEDESEVVASLTAAVLKQVEEIIKDRVSKGKKKLDKEELYNQAITVVKRELELERAFFIQYAKDKPNAAAIKQGAFLEVADNQDMADIFSEIFNHFDEIRDKHKKITFIGFRQRILLELSSLSFKLLEENELSEDERGIIEKNYFTDAFNFTQDPEKSLSAKMRRALFFVPKVDRDGNIETNILGMDKYENYLKTHNRLKYLLADIPINEMLGELESAAKTSPQHKAILDELNVIVVKDPGKLKEFLTVFRKQSLHFKILLYNEGANGQAHWRTIDSNRAEAHTILFDLWHENFKIRAEESGILKREGITLEIDSKKAKEVLNKKYNGLLKKLQLNKIKSDDAFKEMKEILKSLGVDISDNTIADIQKDRKYGNKKLLKRFNITKKEARSDELFFGRTIGYLINELISGRAAIKETYKRRNPYFNQETILKGFASYEIVHNPDLYTASFRNAEGKMYYSFVSPHHLSNRVMNLKDGKLAESLLNISFLKSSIWMNQIHSEDKDFINNFELFYFDATKNDRITTQLGKYEDQNASDKANTRVSLFQNQEKKTGLFFSNTPSDKTTFTLIQALKHIIELGDLSQIFSGGEINLDKIDLNSSSVEALYKLVEAEFMRINTVAKEFATKIGTDKERFLVPGYHYINTPTGKVIGGGNYIFSFPQLNDIVIRNADGSILLSEKAILEIKKALVEQVFQLVNDTIISWDKLEVIDFLAGTHKFDGSYIGTFSNKISAVNEEHNIINYAATDYVINNLIAQMNMFQLITGDPATFTKAPKNWTPGDWRSLIDSSSVNLFKRVAKDIAPGEEGAFETATVNYIYLNEPKVTSELTKLKGKLEKLGLVYDGLEIADGQEWVTAEEHINVLYAYGRLSKKDKNNLLQKIKEKEDLNPEEIAKILQPQKPVYSGLDVSNEFNLELPVYIKTSAFPLLRQFTRGSAQLTIFREMLEQNDIQRAVTHTGVKVGYYNELDFFGPNGQINDMTDVDVKSYIHTLSREGFRIQQDIPYKESKNTILYGSQLGKLKFANLPEGLTFNLDGKDYTGYELKKLEDQLRITLYERRLKSLLNDLGVKNIEDGIDDVNQLRLEIIKEAEDRKYSFNDILLLNSMTTEKNSTEFTVPLFFHSSGTQIESLLNSIITNRVLKNEFAGKSYVQGSSIGFEFETTNIKDFDFLEETMDKKYPIIFTKDYDGKRLSYKKRIINGEEVIEAQVLLPSFFRFKGKRVNLNNFIKDGYLDTSKISPELLEMIGYRIPTQGFNSMVRLKVVGFLPEVVGDLIIVPPEITKQMGADFDVDKLYVHFYNYKFQTDPENPTKILSIFKEKYNIEIENNLIKNRGISTSKIQNFLLDINMTIISKTEVTEMLLRALDNDVLSKEGELIQDLLKQGEIEIEKRKSELQGPIKMQQNHIDSIKAGNKKLTSRRNAAHSDFYKGDGIYETPDGTLITIYYLEEAHVLDYSVEQLEIIAKAEGFESLLDMQKNGRKETINWINGKGTKHFYAVEVLDKTVKEGPQLPTSNVDVTKASMSSILYEGHQTHVVNINSDGKVGIAINSVYSTQHILAQHAGLHVQMKMEYNPLTKEMEPDRGSALPIVFEDDNGNPFVEDLLDATNRVVKFKYSKYVSEEGAWRLDKIRGFTGKLISEVLTNIQNASVDNANKQELFGLFLNKETFGIASTMARLGFDERYIAAVINQPIIRDYITQLKELNKITDIKFRRDSQQRLEEAMMRKYSNSVTIARETSTLAFSLRELRGMIQNGGQNRDRQLDIFTVFRRLDTIAKKLQSVNVATNIDTKFLDKDIHSSLSTKSKYERLVNQVEDDTIIIGNLKNFLNGTVQFGAIKNGLLASLKLFSSPNIIPLDTPLIKGILEEIAILRGDEEGGALLTPAEINSIVANLRGAMFNLAVTDILSIKNITKVHEDLMYNTETNKSLASELLKLKRTSNNFLVQVLQANLNYNETGIDIIKYEASKDIKGDINKDLVLAWSQLLKAKKNSKEYKLGKNLILYVVLNGNDRNFKSFGRFLPSDFYVDSGLYKVLRSINFIYNKDNPEEISISNLTAQNFVRQYIQHFPSKATAFLPTQVKNRINQDKSTNAPFDLLIMKSRGGDVGMQNLFLRDPVTHEDYPTPYIQYYNEKEKKVILYEYVGYDETGQHVRYAKITTLGNKQNLLTEFNLNGEINETAFKDVEQSTSSKIQFTSNNTSTVAAAVPIPNPSAGKSQNIMNRYMASHGLIKSLESIVSRAVNPANANLAKLILDKYKDVLSKYKLEAYDINNPNHWNEDKQDVITPKGRTKYAQRLILINQKKLENEEHYEEILLHEITHVLTTVLLESSNLTGNAKIARDNLIDLFNELKINKNFLAKLEEGLAEEFQGENAVELGKKRAEYMMDSPKEFVAYIFGNDKARRVLNEFKVEDKNLLDKFFEFVTKLLNFTVKEGSALEAAVQNVLTLMTSYTVKTEQQVNDALQERLTSQSFAINKTDEKPTEEPITEVPTTETSIVIIEDTTTGYASRTKKNASADATIAIAVNFDSAGERLTKKSVLNQEKEYIPIDISNDLSVDFNKIVKMLNDAGDKTLSPTLTLNIAGNGIYTMKGKYTQKELDIFVEDLIATVIAHPDLKKPIGAIRSGGQTGIDEAGAKAGARLGVITSILAPKGYKFRNEKGQDISSEPAFKARFGIQVPTATISKQIPLSKDSFLINKKGDDLVDFSEIDSFSEFLKQLPIEQRRILVANLRNKNLIIKC